MDPQTIDLIDNGQRAQEVWEAGQGYLRKLLAREIATLNRQILALGPSQAQEHDRLKTQRWEAMRIRDLVKGAISQAETAREAVHKPKPEVSYP